MAEKAICAIDGCNNPVLVKSRGWCSKHYQRWQHTGDPELSLYNREQTGKPCCVPGCEKPSGFKGMCAMHRNRMNKHGSVSEDALHPRHRRIQKWLEANVSYTGDDCLKWPFGVGDKGRGSATVPGMGVTSAPNAMCRLAHGDPPTPEHEAAHSCGKGHEGCINPRHLSWKTHIENQADMVLHGTRRRGTQINTNKLTEDEVREIRALDPSVSNKEGAAMFGVSHWTIWEIRTRRSWAWLDAS